MSEPARRRRVETVPFESQRRQAVDSSPHAIGRLIGGKYAIETVLGKGSCGTVYRAKQLALDKTVAIKVLHREMSLDPALVERFQREARAASRLDHPSSIRVFDFGQEDDGLLYLVMEYVEGRDLLTVLNQEGALDPRRIAIIVSQILAALAVAHDQGIVHRDLKPENILVTKGLTDDGETIDVVKVCDFGIAALAKPAPGAMRLTARGLVVGTPEYMSPEQARGIALDGRSDLYAVGALLYHLLTLRVPFSGPTPVATAVMHVTTPLVAPSELVPSVDPYLENICIRALAKHRDNRFADARQMRAALREVLTARGSKMPPLPSLRPKALPTNDSSFAEPSSNELQVTSTSIEPRLSRRRSVARSIAIALAVVAGVVMIGGLGVVRRAQQRARFERAAAAANLEHMALAPEPTPSASVSVKAAPSSIARPSKKKKPR
jgi:serine/threonine protein kinase